MEEIWRPVLGYEERYEVSNLGNVRSMHYLGSNKIKNLSLQNCNGYKRAYFKVNMKGFHKLVHVLVYEAFNGKIPEGLEIEHINGKREDNSLSNLRAVTHKENTNNPITKERMRISNKTNCKNKKKCRYVNENKNFDSIKDLSEYLGFSTCSVIRALKRNKKILGEYEVEYI